MTTRHEAESLTLIGHAEMTVDYRKIFSQRLYDLIMDKGVSQAEVARATSISKDMISKYVKGDSKPGGANLLKIAQYFNVEPGQLMPSRLDQRGEEGDVEFYTRLTSAERNPLLGRIEICQVVRMSTALKIMQLLDEDAQARNDNDGRAAN